MEIKVLQTSEELLERQVQELSNQNKSLENSNHCMLKTIEKLKSENLDHQDSRAISEKAILVLENRLEESKYLEGRALQAVEDNQLLKQQLQAMRQQYECLNSLLQTFKRQELSKFNYVLKQNLAKHKEAKAKIQSQETLISTLN